MEEKRPKVVYITAGAGGMYCGSCIRDNTLVAGLEELGWDVLLLPLYTPIRVDEEDHSIDQVFFGGINIYLQQKIPLFRYLPAFFDRWLDNPGLIRRVASGAMSVSAAELGELTLSMVKGEHGYQRKEVRRLVQWLTDIVKPDLICLTNLLVGGCIPALQREIGVPVLVTLQGDDVFLDELEAPWKEQVLSEMKALAQAADGFLTFSEYYRDEMATLFEVSPEKFFLTPLGATIEEFDTVLAARKERSHGQVIGYFARLSPEKGFDLLIDAFVKLAPRFPEAELRVAGWLSEKDKPFYAEQLAKIEEAGLSERFAHVEAPDGEAKKEFFEGLDLFSVPTRFIEPKGLYLLEAFACGLPVVEPEKGIFPELIQASGGGVLFDHGSSDSLARALGDLLESPEKAAAMGVAGRAWVEENGGRKAMSTATSEVFREVLKDGKRS